jgi:hypothetical protein
VNRQLEYQRYGRRRVASPAEIFLSNLRRAAGRGNQAALSWREDNFGLLESAIFDLLHEGFALEEVAPEVGGEPEVNHEELIVGNFEKETEPRAGIKCAPVCDVQHSLMASARRQSDRRRSK